MLTDDMGVKTLTGLGVNYEEDEPDENAEHVLITWNRKARNVQVSPETILPYILEANI